MAVSITLTFPTCHVSACRDDVFPIEVNRLITNGTVGYTLPRWKFWVELELDIRHLWKAA